MDDLLDTQVFTRMMARIQEDAFSAKAQRRRVNLCE
jgi:hypothetical protein